MSRKFEVFGLRFLIFGFGFLTFGFNSLQAQIPNTIISKLNTPNEPSIAMHPQNPNILWAGTNHNNVYYSKDGGQTWETEFAVSKFGCGGDPVMHINKKGDLFYFHLSNPPQGKWIDRIVAQRRSSFSQNWEVDTFTGLTPPKNQDKHWVAENPISGNLYLTWTQFDVYGSKSEKDFTNIMFSKSTDDGATWSKAKDISAFAGDCIDDDNTVEGAVPAADKNGNLFVTWAGPKGLVFQKSTDDGASWFTEEKILEEIPGGWNYDVEGIYRSNGMPITAIDNSNSNFSGSVYVSWSDERNGTTNKDVFIKYSRDQGQTWSETKKINNDPTQNEQFLSWLTIDQTTGFIYAVFYDRRNHYDTKTDVFLAVSKNGGETFENFEISESYFEPNKEVFFGDYTNIAATKGVAQAIWTRLDNKDLSLITARIELNKLPKKSGFNVTSSSDYLIVAKNQNGETISTLAEKVSLNKGLYSLQELNVKTNLSPGLYYLELQLLSDKSIIDRLSIKVE